MLRLLPLTKLQHAIAWLLALGGFASSASAITFEEVTQIDGSGANHFNGVLDGNKFYTIFAHAGDQVRVDLSVFGQPVTGGQPLAGLVEMLVAFASDGTVNIGDGGVYGPNSNGLLVSLGNWTETATDTISLNWTAHADGEWAIFFHHWIGHGEPTPYSLNVYVNGVSNVPESSATLWLLGASLALIALARRRLSL